MDIIKNNIQKFGLDIYKIPDNFSLKHNDKLFVIDEEGFIMFSAYHHIKEGHRPPRFHVKNPYTIENIKLWLRINNKPFTLISEVYEKASYPLEWRCSKCNKIFKLSWGHIKNGEGCRHCKYENFKKERMLPKSFEDSLLYKYPDICKEWDYTRNEKDPSEYTPGSERLVWWICPNCKRSYQASIIHRTKDGSACPLCKESRGERKIREYLTNHDISFIAQYRFDDCRNKRPLPFDFYLPNYNMCIEFQGEQHYKPYDFATYSYDTEEAMNTYRRTLHTDGIKKQYCKDNNIVLLEIKYNQINIIPKILDNVLLI